MNSKLKAFLMAAGLSSAAITGAQLTDKWEGNSLTVYVDAVGVLTACRGHTSKDLKLGQTFTEQQCMEIFAKDIARAGLLPAFTRLYAPQTVAFHGNRGRSGRPEARVEPLRNTLLTPLYVLPTALNPPPGDDSAIGRGRPAPPRTPIKETSMTQRNSILSTLLVAASLALAAPAMAQGMGGMMGGY